MVQLETFSAFKWEQLSWLSDEIMVYPIDYESSLPQINSKRQIKEA